MARPTISQRIALEGGDQIKRALADLGKAGEEAFTQLQKAGEKVNLSAPAAAIEQATRRAGATVDELRQRITGAGGAAAQSGAGLPSSAARFKPRSSGWSRPSTSAPGSGSPSRASE